MALLLEWRFVVEVLKSFVVFQRLADILCTSSMAFMTRPLSITANATRHVAEGLVSRIERNGWIERKETSMDEE
jgi:hypothetical protein